MLTALAMLLGGCGDGGPAAMICEAGAEAAHDGNHQRAVRIVGACLAIPGLSKDVRAHALEARAWSHSNLKQPALAVADQEAAYKLRPPSQYHQYINYAWYLRGAGRVQDSLNAVLGAESLEAGAASMMTQYNKGWSLLELGRHREAVDAFTRGIPVQPDYAFVYWRRGLAYEHLGESEQARSDFERSAKLLIDQKNTAAAGELLPLMRDKLRRYGIHHLQL